MFNVTFWCKIYYIFILATKPMGSKNKIKSVKTQIKYNLGTTFVFTLFLNFLFNLLLNHFLKLI